MANIEEIKKFKELLDNGIITEDEFQKKKSALLGTPKKLEENEEQKIDADISYLPSKKKRLNKNAKMIIGIISAALVVVAIALGIPQISNAIYKREICNAAADAIRETMDAYGLSDYKVKYASMLGTDVFCPEFEELSSAKKCALIKATLSLGDITVNDEEIGLDCDIYVNSRDYYYYISPFQAAQSFNSYECGGLYKNDGNIYCVYEEK